MMAIENLTATTLRNIVGELDLDGTLTSRDTVNTKITAILDEATDKWGIKVNRVELKNILPPREIQDAMERQMKAERERREKIKRAEGEKRSQILVAEGEKEAEILRAQAEKEATILRADARLKVKQLRSAPFRKRTQTVLRSSPQLTRATRCSLSRASKHSRKPLTARLPRSLSRPICRVLQVFPQALKSCLPT